MGQIVGLNAKCKRANLNALSLVPTPANGEIILVSSDNSMTSDGQGNFDYYIKGNGQDAAVDLPLQDFFDAKFREYPFSVFDSQAISVNNTARISLVNTDGTLVYSAASTGGRAFIKFPDGLVDGTTYNMTYSWEKSANNNDIWLQFTNAVGGSPVIQGSKIPQNSISGDGFFTFTKVASITGFYIASTDIGAGNTLTLSNIEIYHDVLIKDIILSNKDRIDILENDVNGVEIDTITDFSDAKVSMATSPSSATITNNNGTITINCSATGGRAMLLFPDGMVDGYDYILSFDYTMVTNKTVYVNFTTNGSQSLSNFSIVGTSGKAEAAFTKTSEILGVYFPTSDIGAGNTLTITNIKVCTKNSVGEEFVIVHDYINTNKGNIKQLRDEYDISQAYFPYDINAYEEGVTWSEYTGNCIKPANQFGYKLIKDRYGNIFYASQGIAIYKETMFLVRPGCGSFGWFNMRTKDGRYANNTLSQDCPFLSTADSHYHANSVAFSDIFYDVNDEFPLLYVGGGEYAKEGIILVARVVRYDDKYTYHLELVQTIDSTAILSYSNIAMENGYMYLAGHGYIKKCNVPAIFDNGNVVSSVTMTTDDVVQSWERQDFGTPQGSCIRKGILYQVSGGTGSARLNVFDTNLGVHVNTIELASVGLPTEPESVAFYRETLILSVSGGLYRVWM